MLRPPVPDPACRAELHVAIHLGVGESQIDAAAEPVPELLVDRSNANHLPDRHRVERGTGDRQGPVLAALDQGAEEFLPRLECHFEGLVAAEPNDLGPLDREIPHVVGGVVERSVRQVLHLSGDPVPVRHHDNVGLLSLKGCYGTQEGEGKGAASRGAQGARHTRGSHMSEGRDGPSLTGFWGDGRRGTGKA